RRFVRDGIALAALASAPLVRTAWADAKPDRWSLFETARDSEHRGTRIDAPPSAPGSAATISVGTRGTGPAILGFGGALTESAAYVLAKLPKEKRMDVLRSYFDPEHGIGYQLARTPMTSCDFSLKTWSLDDVAGDTALRHFSLAPMRALQLPLLR